MTEHDATDYTAHREREGTHCLSNRYWWSKLYDKFKEYVKVFSFARPEPIRKSSVRHGHRFSERRESTQCICRRKKNDLKWTNLPEGASFALSPGQATPCYGYVTRITKWYDLSGHESDFDSRSDWIICTASAGGTLICDPRKKHLGVAVSWKHRSMGFLIAQFLPTQADLRAILICPNRNESLQHWLTVHVTLSVGTSCSSAPRTQILGTFQPGSFIMLVREEICATL